MSFRATTSSTWATRSSSKSGKKKQDGVVRRLTDSFRKPPRATIPRSPRYTNTFSIYNGLTWDMLHGYLQSKWPEHEFVEYRVDDKWVFETPEELTQEHKDGIMALRDRVTQRRESQSPEPGQQQP